MLGNEKVTQFMSEPKDWDAFERRNEVQFSLAEDQFLVLGDNGACSRDSRLWENSGFEFYVKRELLIGKAIFVYWPHSWDEMPIPFTDAKIPFPFFPNFEKMRLVR